ncbi:hypothetical protein [Streptomyces sp. NPDC002566]|uniref:hypothetical protein n=1 Tax=Streptomyces sp. NPDC002566 TaxID=3364650 RepID=UPI00369BF46B
MTGTSSGTVQVLPFDLAVMLRRTGAFEGRYDSAEPGWRSGVEWTLLWIENTASQLTEDRPGAGTDGRQGVSPE